MISGNSNAGVVFSDSGTTGNGVYGNFIGTDVDRAEPLANHYGVQVLYGASNNTDRHGRRPQRHLGQRLGRRAIVRLGHQPTIRSRITTSAPMPRATPPLANTGSGVALAGGASYNYIDYNVISGNQGDGVYISDSGTNYNSSQSDYIGTDATGYVRRA